MPRDTRTIRDLHALDEHGFVLCNPRDREAAHRAENEGIATDDPAAVTCSACLKILHRRAREDRASIVGDTDSATPAVAGPTVPGTFVRIRDAATMAGNLREGDGIDPRLQRGKSTEGRRKPDHGKERLAGQIFDCLQFSSVLSDVGLEGFAFIGVLTSGSSGQFVVELACIDPTLDFEPGEIERVMMGQRARVRSEVAQGVHRRKAPNITFRVKPPGYRPG